MSTWQAFILGVLALPALGGAIWGLAFLYDLLRSVATRWHPAWVARDLRARSAIAGECVIASRVMFIRLPLLHRAIILRTPVDGRQNEPHALVMEIERFITDLARKNTKGDSE
jgi:hypothetical protein